MLSVYAERFFCKGKSLASPPVFEATSVTDVRAQPAKYDKTCQPETHHSSAHAMENCQEVFAIEVLQIPNFAKT
jgi:hypothetical protein